MFALFRSLSLRDLRQHTGQSALIVASIALGVIAWTTTWTLNQLLEASLRESSTPASGADLHVSNADVGLAIGLVDQVAKVPGVRSANPVVIQRIRIATDAAPKWVSATLIGVNLETDQDHGENPVKVSKATAEAFVESMVMQQNPVISGIQFGQRYGLAGKPIHAIVGGRNQTLACLGALESEGALSGLGGSILITSHEKAAELCGHPERISRIDVELDPETDLKTVKTMISKVLGTNAEVVTPLEQEGRTSESLEALRQGFTLCGFGALGLAMFLIATVLGVSVSERSRTIGLLRSLGCTKGQIRVQILGEALFLGVLGSVVGVAGGFGLAHFIAGPLLTALGDVFLPLQSKGVIFSPSVALSGMSAGLLTCMLAALLPASRASGLAPTLAMKRERVLPSSNMRIRILGGSSLLCAAMGLFATRREFNDPIRVYGALVCVLLGMMVLIPLMTSLMARLLRPIVEHLAGIPGRLAVESLIRSPSRTGSTIAGLAGSVAFMVQTGGVIQGNEQAVRSWVDQCISGDLFVTSGGPMSASGRTIPMDHAIGNQISQTLPQAKVVAMQFLHLDWSSRQQKTKILMLSLDAQAYVEMTSDRIPPLTDRMLYQQLLEPDTALVSENFAAINRLGVGSHLTLPGLKGPVRLKIVGTVVDFSNNRGTIMVDRVGTGQAFGNAVVDHFAVGLKNQTDLEQARRSIAESGWASESAVEVMTRPALRNHILGMIRSLYGVAYVQEIIAAAVAALGVSSSMLICIMQRRREIALLRAIGSTSRQLFVTVLAEALIMAVIGTFLGVLMGLGLEWYVLRVILLMETGFNFPVVLPWVDFIMITAVIGTASLLAGLFPALSATRIPIGIALARD
ncbi:MAG: FtsX-like permease family protein [Planctomycetota bacterium]